MHQDQRKLSIAETELDCMSFVREEALEKKREELASLEQQRQNIGTYKNDPDYRRRGEDAEQLVELEQRIARLNSEIKELEG